MPIYEHSNTKAEYSNPRIPAPECDIKISYTDDFTHEPLRPAR